VKSSRHTIEPTNAKYLCGKGQKLWRYCFQLGAQANSRSGSNCDIDAGCDGSPEPKADARHGSNESRPD
jgi:hypothetical protein